MKKLFFVLLLLFTNRIFAQNFNKLFTIENVNTITTGTTIINDKIYITGYMNDTLEFGNGIKTFIAKFDANGNQLGFKTFRDSAYLHFVTETPPYVINNQMYVYGYLRDTTSFANSHPPFHAFLLNIDTNLNARLLLNYVDSSTVYFVPTGMIAINTNKTFILTGTNQHYHSNIADQHTQPFTLKLDSDGTVNSYSEYNVINRIGVHVKTILSHHNKLFLTINGDSTLFVGDPICHIRTINYLLELDTACNLLATYNYSDSNAYASNSTIYYNNRYYGCGNDIIERLYIGTSGNIAFKAAVFKFNSQYNFVSKNIFADTIYNPFKGFQKIKLVSNESNLIISGGVALYYGVNTKNYGRNGIMTKIDTTGNIIWERQYRGYTDTVNVWPYRDEHNELIDFDFLSDGSIIALGNIFIANNNPNIIHGQGWLMRLSPDGCLSTNDCGFETGVEEPKPIYSTTKNYIKVYPNPSNSYVAFEYKVPCANAAHIEVYNATGIAVLNEEVSGTQSVKIINASTFVDGVYFYKLVCDNNLIGQGNFVIQK